MLWTYRFFTLLLTLIVSVISVLPQAPAYAQTVTDPSTGITTTFDGSPPSNNGQSNGAPAAAAPQNDFINDEFDWKSVENEPLEDQASFMLMYIGCPAYPQVPCDQKPPVAPAPSAPRQPVIPPSSPQPSVSVGSCISPRDEVKNRTGVDIKQKGTGSAGEPCIFAWRGRPNKTWAKCPSGFVCVWDIGNRVIVLQGNGQQREIFAGDWRWIEAYSAGTGARNPCLLLAKVQTYLRSQGSNTQVGLEGDAGFGCNFPLPDVSLDVGHDTNTPSFPTPNWCPKGKDADDLFGIDVEAEPGFETNCLYFWRGGYNVEPRAAKCPANWECDMQIVPPSASDATYAVAGNDQWYQVRGVSYRPAPSGYDWCGHVWRLDDYLAKNNKGQAITVGYSCDNHRRADPHRVR